MIIPNLSPAWYGIVAERMQAGWAPHLLTFMFDRLPGSDRGIERRQSELVEDAYGRLVTRVHRRPASRAAVGRLPIWICAPDFPVPKSCKKTLAEVSINGGRHMHAFSVMPPRSRLREDLADHLAREQDALYVRPGGLTKIHAELITHGPRYVFDYATKSIIRGRVHPETILLLPRSISEVSAREAPVGRQSSLYASPRKQVAPSWSSSGTALLK